MFLAFYDKVTTNKASPPFHTFPFLLHLLALTPRAGPPRFQKLQGGIRLRDDALSLTLSRSRAFYWTVKVTVVVCVDAPLDVPVTVTVYVPDGVPPPPPPPLLLPPP